jgi:hypothetical protein
MNRLLACATAVGLLATAASAQVNYSFNFDANSTGWTGNFTRFAGTTACGGSGGAMRRNLYSGATTGSLVSPSTGTSTGGTTTITYDYKVANWSANSVATPASWGSFDVQYGATVAGPWTTFATVSNEAQLGNPCQQKTHSFTPPAGPLFIRWSATLPSGSPLDYYLNFDNVALVESASPCSGTPAPGNTVAPTNVCPGTNYVLSLQNSTPGNGVTYQWYSSTTGATGPWNAGPTSPTWSTNQTVDTWYYCDVTCSAGPATGSSAVAAVATNPLPAAFPRDFEGCGGLTAAGWTVAGSSTILPTLNAVSAFGVGAGAIGFNFYNASNGATLTLTSPTFPAVGAGTQIYFDVAGATYTGGEIDQIVLEESNDGGTTWTAVTTMTNAPNGVGVLNTSGALAPPFNPTAAQWASLAYPLSAGANQIRFRGVSNFGNFVYLDNISVGILPSARHTAYGVACSTGFNLSAAPAPVAGSTFTYAQAGIPEAAPASGVYFGVVVMSLGQLQPGVPLNTLTAGLVDSPCNLNVAGLDVTLTYVSATPTDSSVTFAVPLTAPAGILLYAQSAALIVPVAPNNAGVVTSTAVRTFINTF